MINEKNKNERQSNIELLRIVMMLIIVYSHFSTHSNFIFNKTSLNCFFIPMTRLGELGVTCFVLISGFFSINSNKFLSKIVNLILEIWFYNVAIIGILIASGSSFTIEEIIKSVIPIYNTHWFAYAFVFLYLLIPFINFFLKNIERYELEKLLMLLGSAWGIIYPFTGADLNFSYLGWFVFLYMFGAYLSLYPTKINNKRMLFVALICIMILWGSTIVFEIISNMELIETGQYINYLYSMYSPFIWIFGIVLFKLALQLNIGTIKTINYISSSTFAVYIISDNQYLRNIIWNDLFDNCQFSNSSMLGIIGFLETVIVFATCIFIDKVRIFIFNKVKIELIVNALIRGHMHIRKK